MREDYVYALSLLTKGNRGVNIRDCSISFKNRSRDPFILVLCKSDHSPLTVLIPALFLCSSENRLSTREKIHKVTVHLMIKLVWSGFVQ